jgi:hypothetical protein
MPVTTIAEMQRDRAYYTVPWALNKNKRGEHWLAGDYPAEFRPHGTLRMQVQKDPGGSYHVWVPKGEQVSVSPWKPDPGDGAVSHVNGRKVPLPFIRQDRKRYHAESNRTAKAAMSQASGEMVTEMREAQFTAKARGITASPFLNDPPDVGVGDYGQYADASDYGYFRRLWIENHDWWALFNMTRVMEMG